MVEWAHNECILMSMFLYLLRIGGLMGFKILPYEDGDDKKYDVFTLTSKKKWNPHKNKKLHTCSQDFSISSKDEDSSIDDSLPDLKLDIKPEPVTPEKDSRSCSTSEPPDLDYRGDLESSDSSNEDMSDESFVPPEVISISTPMEKRHSTKHTRSYRKQCQIFKKGRMLKRPRRRRIMHTVTDCIDKKYYAPTDEDEIVKDISVNKAFHIYPG